MNANQVEKTAWGFLAIGDGRVVKNMDTLRAPERSGHHARALTEEDRCLGGCVATIAVRQRCHAEVACVRSFAIGIQVLEKRVKRRFGNFINNNLHEAAVENFKNIHRELPAILAASGVSPHDKLDMGMSFLGDGMVIERQALGDEYRLPLIASSERQRSEERRSLEG